MAGKTAKNKTEKTSAGKAVQQEVVYQNQERFQTAVEKIADRTQGMMGIGTLSEKTLHAIMKHYYEPNEDYHEVPLEGYVADIYNQNGVIEIQNGNFNKMRAKLAVFLNLYPVTIVYPLPCHKWVSWINPETGETSKRRKAPKVWKPYHAFWELYKIKSCLHHPNLHIRIVMVDMEEYRLLNGWNESRKRGSTRYDRIPLGICEETVIDQPEDYIQFVPYELEDGFSVKEFAKAAHIDADTARTTLNILYEMEAVRRVGKQGNAYLYAVKAV